MTRKSLEETEAAEAKLEEAEAAVLDLAMDLYPYLPAQMQAAVTAMETRRDEYRSLVQALVAEEPEARA